MVRICKSMTVYFIDSFRSFGVLLTQKLNVGKSFAKSLAVWVHISIYTHYCCRLKCNNWLLQYKRDTNKPIKEGQPGKVIDEEGATLNDDENPELMNIDAVDELITFTGNCEFCNNPIKPFPTLHQQVRTWHWGYWSCTQAI